MASWAEPNRSSRTSLARAKTLTRPTLILLLGLCSSALPTHEPPLATPSTHALHRRRCSRPAAGPLWCRRLVELLHRYFSLEYLLLQRYRHHCTCARLTLAEPGRRLAAVRDNATGRGYTKPSTMTSTTAVQMMGWWWCCCCCGGVMVVMWWFSRGAKVVVLLLCRTALRPRRRWDDVVHAIPGVALSSTQHCELPYFLPSSSVYCEV
jgi:hypothetical protein